MTEQRVCLEPSDIDKLEAAAKCLRDQVLIDVLYDTAGRISEILGVAVPDIDFEHSTVTVEHLKLRIKRSCLICGARLSKTAKFCPGCGIKIELAKAEEKKTQRFRTLPLSPSTLKLLREYIDRGGPVLKDGKLLLFGITRNHAWKIIRDCADRAGLPKLINPETRRLHGVSPHRIRDAFATHALDVDDSGVGQRLLQEQLGHAHFDTTAKYKKVSGRELKQWHRKIKEGRKDGGTSGNTNQG